MEALSRIFCIILSIIIITSANASLHSIISDEESLLAFKDHITIDPNQILTKNWTAGSPICGWIGVTCGKRHFRVTSLDISSMGLTGTIIPHLGNLSFLVSLNLSYNNFHGDIPYELDQLRRLKWLKMRDNALTGEIPSSVGSLKHLEYLRLSNNSFTGSIPSSISNLTNLKYLILNNNGFTGEIPSSVGFLHQLESLDLGNNTFHGSIPSSISNLTNLKILFLNNNSFTGSIPLEIFNISSLQVLFLPYNQLSGSLPTSMCRYLPQITQIEVGFNMLSGPLPSQLSQCSQLTNFGVSENNISGTIPKEFWNLKLLETALFADNRLEGTIPEEVSNLTSLQYLILDGNHLTGTIPQEIGNLINLQQLSFTQNYLTGAIPRQIGNLSNLQILDFGQNNLTGTVPEDLGNLVNLEYLSVAFNGLGGLVPESIFNISTLNTLQLSFNSLSGSLPLTTAFQLPHLENFLIAKNSFSGVLPLFISNASSLTLIDVSDNNFGGTIPHSLGNLRFLQYLKLGTNNFTMDPSSLELEFFTALANCNALSYLDFTSNPLNGILPKSIGNLSKSIEYFYGDISGISGEIPVSIGNLSNLLVLSLSSNQLAGSLPTSIVSLQNIQGIFLSDNHLSGSLSCNLFGLKGLYVMHLDYNMYSGPIPECIGNSSKLLRNIRLDANKLNSNIPMTLWNLKDLLELTLSSNFLNGSVPVQVGNLNVLISLDLSMNNLSGYIPDAIGNLQNLANLSLSNNLFEGSIPNSIGKMVSLVYLYLSENNLSGSIPTNLEKLTKLLYLNVSYNNLDGLIPSGGPFVNFTAESFMFNKALCGDKKFNVTPCLAISPKKSWIKGHKHMLVLCFGSVALIVAVTLVSVYLILRRKKKIQQAKELQLTILKERISFYELHHATNGYNEINLLGQGSFGSVYRATLRDGRVVAVKVFNLQIEGAFKSFDTECEVLRSLRHRNLTQVISSCSNLDFKAIVLEFMPNGSLDNWLHSTNHFLSFTERLNIMIDVAYALHYLHSGYLTPVVHADLKPSNVLLDESKVAHVSDFGISKMLVESSITYTKTLATFGYIAPEYGSEGLVSTKCDVYSFGIMLMEVFTRKSPNDEMFSESLTLHDWINNSMDSALAEIIDDDLLNTADEEYFASMMDHVMKIMKIALNCTKILPRERSDIGEVLVTLNKIKLKL